MLHRPVFSVMFGALAIAAAALLIPCFALEVAASSDNSARIQRRLSLSATGTVSVRPDMATISTGIETEGVKAREALSDNNEIMADMMKSLRANGIDEDDMTTSGFSIQPRYQYPRNGMPPRIIGYKVSNSLTIRVRDLARLGTILDKLASAGSNRMGSLSFSLQDPEKVMNEARRKAMEKVIRRANLYAAAAGVRLGRIISISENASRYVPRPMMMAKSSRMMASSVPIAPGKRKNSVTVHVTWELLD